MISRITEIPLKTPTHLLQSIDQFNGMTFSRYMLHVTVMIDNMNVKLAQHLTQTALGYTVYIQNVFVNCG